MKKTLAVMLVTLALQLSYADPPSNDAQTNYSAAYENSHILKFGPGQLVLLLGYNSKASAQFIQLFDATAVPADGTAPLATFTVPASSNFSLASAIQGIVFNTGIVICNSSTGPTKTIGAADCFFTGTVRAK